MTSPCLGCAAAPLCRAANQPFGVEVTTADGVFIKQMHIPDAFTVVPQHSHGYEHASMLAVGEVNLLVPGEPARHYVAPCAIVIPPGVKHAFQSLVDNTVVYCIHNVARDGAVKVVEEHDPLGE